ncbi:MAG: zinc ABC transporter substrate-binding protein [Planctomycetaceae bacterium]|nr:zinc ABC transporter substrate-binding protein [Planctomycetaceae bacterium]
MSRRLALFVIAIAGLIISGCSQSADEQARAASVPLDKFAGGRPIRVVCTTGMVADLVRNVGGDRVHVEQLMGEGVDPHLYKSSPGDLSRLDAADVIFYSGLHLEGKMAELFERIAARKRTIAVTANLAHDRLIGDENSHDPHVWMDVALWSETTQTVLETLSEFDPTHAAEYQSRQSEYREQLAALDQECRAKLAAIPAERRVLVTAHDAFSYFGRAYQTEVRAIQGISTESEAGVREINDLVSFLVERKIKAVFVETSVSDRNIQALIEGCQSRGHRVTIGGALYSDAMGAAGTPEGTYIGMIRKNVATIVDALK